MKLQVIKTNGKSTVKEIIKKFQNTPELRETIKSDVRHNRTLYSMWTRNYIYHTDHTRYNRMMIRRGCKTIETENYNLSKIYNQSLILFDKAWKNGYSTVSVIEKKKNNLQVNRLRRVTDGCFYSLIKNAIK